MNSIVINGHVFPSIWKSSNKQARQIQARYSPAYRDPTANIAIGNVLREERKKKCKKRPKSKKIKRK